MYCPNCGKKMIWNSDFDEDLEPYYQVISFFSCDSCDILVEKITTYGGRDPEETIFSIVKHIEDDDE